jgi:type IV pilus assembly protein PilN
LDSGCVAWSNTVIRINLLPQEERVRRRKLPVLKIPQVGAVVPFAVLGALVVTVATVSTIQSRKISTLQEESVVARREAESYKPQLEKIRQITQKREEVRSHLDIVAKLDRQRYYRVQLLDELTKSMPQNMWVTQVEELSERRFQIDGVTFSNFIVARFMQNLESADRWTQVDLDIAEEGDMDDIEVVKFTLFSNAQP